MKKRLIIGFMVCAMLLLVACGKEKVTDVAHNDTTNDETVEETLIEREATGTLQLEDCFALTGRGFIITGDVISGSIHVGDEAVIALEDGTKIEVKVAELQMFQQTESPEEAVEGEHVGVLVDLPERIEITSNDKMLVYGKEETNN